MPLSDPVLWVELAMLSALLTCGLCAAYTDLRFQRVPNRFLVVGYRLLEWGLKPEGRPVVVIPGLAALALLAVTTGGWKDYALIWGAASLVELAFQQVRRGSGRAYRYVLPVDQLRPGAVLRRRMVLAGDDGGEVIREGGESLDPERVELLRKRAASGALPGTVELTRALPFVPFLVAGGLATAVFGGHLAPPVRALLVWING